MATGGAESLLRKTTQPSRPTFLEIFFDLVFVFALSRMTQRLVDELTSERRIVLPEAGQTLILLLATYMIWLVTTLITNLYNPHRPQIQLMAAIAMLGALLMAVAVPEAFEQRSVLFAAAYVATLLWHGVFFVAALRGHPAQRRAVRTFFWSGISAVPWIVGSFAGDITRAVLWAIAIAIDYVGVGLGQPTPRLGRQPSSEMPIDAEHLSERFRLLFTIALGELILALGDTYSQSELTVGPTVAFIASFVTTTLLWRIYIHKAGALLPAAIAGARDPARLTALSVPAHVLMLAGIIAIAAGIEIVIQHPFGASDPAVTAFMLGGPAVFLAGRAIFEYIVFSRVSLSRALGIATLALISPAMRHLPPLVTAVAPAVVLSGVATADTVRARGRPNEAPLPPR